MAITAQSVPTQNHSYSFVVEKIPEGVTRGFGRPPVTIEIRPRLNLTAFVRSGGMNPALLPLPPKVAHLRKT